MTVSPESVRDCHQAVVAAVHYLQWLGRERRHCIQSCACNVCLPARRMAEQVHYLADEVRAEEMAARDR